MQVALFYGDNRLEIEEALAEAVAACGEEGALLNRERFDAPLDFDAFRRACATMPFLGGMGGRRLIVVRDVLRRGGRALGERLVELLPELPPSTCLFFVEFGDLPRNHPLLKWMEVRKGEKIEALAGTAIGGEGLQPRPKAKVILRRFPLPKTRALPDWIARRVARYGVAMDRAAASLLARQIGTDLLSLDQELRKLATYRGGEGRITREDVALLVPYTLDGDLIFSVVDAIGARNSRQALILLHRMLDAPAAPNPWQVMAMIVRQFRLLIQTRWMLDHGEAASIGARLGIRYDFIIEKLRRQSQLFSAEQLRRAYRLLLDYDRALKGGELRIETALDLLVAQLTGL